MRSRTERDLRQLATSLLDRATEASERAVGAPFNERVKDAISLVSHGEPGVAFENLASNVFEFDVTLSQPEYEAFAKIGRALRIDASEWSDLQGLVRTVPG